MFGLDSYSSPLSWRCRACFYYARLDYFPRGPRRKLSQEMSTKCREFRLGQLSPNGRNNMVGSCPVVGLCLKSFAGSSIIHYRFFGRHFIVLNSVEAALELLEHRSNAYSDRPVVWMYNELAGRGMSVFTVSSQHHHHKIYRRLLQSGLNPRAVQTYRGIMERELRILLDRLLNTPESYAKHLRR